MGLPMFEPKNACIVYLQEGWKSIIKGSYTLVSLLAKGRQYRGAELPALLALATLGGTTQIGLILFVSLGQSK